MLFYFISFVFCVNLTSSFRDCKKVAFKKTIKIVLDLGTRVLKFSIQIIWKNEKCM